MSAPQASATFELPLAVPAGGRQAPGISRAEWLRLAHRAKVLSVTSLAFTPYLGRAKQRIGERMGSVATQGEGQQNMLCAYLSAALLVGLVGNAAFGLWWLDPAVGLLIGGLALKEGIEAWQGEGCCAPGAVPSEPGADVCHDDCCR